MASPNNFYPSSLPGLSDREAVIDAVLRACASIDTKDKALWDSAWSKTRSSEVGFTFRGEQATVGKDKVDQLFAHVSKLDTHHATTSIRAWIHPDGKTASLQAACINNHLPTGSTAKGAMDVYFLVGGRYEVSLVREDEGWKMLQWDMTMAWTQGDRAAVMQG